MTIALIRSMETMIEALKDRGLAWYEVGQAADLRWFIYMQAAYGHPVSQVNSDLYDSEYDATVEALRLNSTLLKKDANERASSGQH